MDGSIDCCEGARDARPRQFQQVCPGSNKEEADTHNNYNHHHHHHHDWCLGMGLGYGLGCGFGVLGVAV